MSNYKKKLIGRDLRSALNTKADLNKEVRVYVKYPLDEDHHSGHEVRKVKINCLCDIVLSFLNI